MPTKKAEPKTKDLVLVAKKITAVVTAEDYAKAAEVRKLAQTIMKAIQASYKKIKQAQDAAKKATIMEEKQQLFIPQEVFDHMTTMMEDYNERMRQLEEKRLEAERKKLEAKATRAEKAGKDEKAEVLREEAESLEVVVAPNRVAAASTRTDIKFEIFDEAIIPRKYCVPSDALIREAVKAGGLSTNIPGVKVYEKQTIVTK